ncbi:MAG: protein-glutamate methylesterase/protein-glutamine glutaminase [bacterium]
MGKVKVLVVDDTALMRKMLSEMLSEDPEIEVVGTAYNGMEALREIERLGPDVVTLDISMPGMDGLEALKVIRLRYRIPVIMVSALTREGADSTIRALELGAFDFITKPEGARPKLEIVRIRRELQEKVRAAVGLPPREDYYEIPKMEEVPPKKTNLEKGGYEIVAIGTSTGGPNALSDMLPLFPGDFPAGIVIVQHMPPTFTRSFAERLNSICQIEVKEAQEGDIVRGGRALIAPGDYHIVVKRERLATVVHLDQSPPVSGHRPSVDVLMRSVAREFGCGAIGVIMTGMGRDGAEGIGIVRRSGGYTIAQSEETCVVYGMPRVAVESGGIDRILPLLEIPREIVRSVRGNETTHENIMKGVKRDG